MKILFIGSVDFSKSALQLLIDLNEDIVGVCTLEESVINSDFVDLKPLAESNNIPVRYTKNINSEESIEWIKSLKPEIIFCFGWSKLINIDVLNIPKMGVIGFHPALLPKNRGRHPIIWALALGLDKTGSTFFFMDQGADTGDILTQDEIHISLSDDASSLYQKITKLALKQIKLFLPLLKNNTFIRITQKHKIANSWRKRVMLDGQIDWRMSANSIFNLVRALTKPYIGAHFVYKESCVKVWRCSIIKELSNNIEPGKIISLTDDGLIIKAGLDAIKIYDIPNNIDLKIGDYL